MDNNITLQYRKNIVKKQDVDKTCMKDVDHNTCRRNIINLYVSRI